MLHGVDVTGEKNRSKNPRSQRHLEFSSEGQRSGRRIDSISNPARKNSIPPHRQIDRTHPRKSPTVRHPPAQSSNGEPGTRESRPVSASIEYPGNIARLPHSPRKENARKNSPQATAGPAMARSFTGRSFLAGTEHAENRDRVVQGISRKNVTPIGGGKIHRQHAGRPANSHDALSRGNNGQSRPIHSLT